MNKFVITLPLLALIACSQNISETPSPSEDIIQSKDDIFAINSSLPDFFNCMDENLIPIISAHRGGNPENSILGMANTLAISPAMMEIDVASIADGTLVLMHDDTVNRTTNGTGPIADLSRTKFDALRIVENSKVLSERPPTLEEALTWADGKTILQLDMKRSVDYDDVIAAVKKAGAEKRVLFIAYTLAQAKILHRKMPDAMISVTITDGDKLAKFEDSGIPSNQVLAWTGNSETDEALYKTLDNKGIEVIFGTLGGRNSIDKKIAKAGSYNLYTDFISNGVDILATDTPAAAVSQIRKNGGTLSPAACL